MATRTTPARSRSAPPPAHAPRGRPAGPALLAALAVIAAGALVWHRALGYFFAQDDFAGLARAQGLMARLSGPWRYLSGQAYFDAMRALAGHQPLAYHLASLLAHGITALLLFRLLARRLSVPAAFVGAVAFVTHPMIFTAVYSISGIGEILALGLALGALLALEQRGATRWLAPPLFALSLLSKESTLLLPLAALAIVTAPGGAPGRARGALPPIAVMAALAAAYALSFATADAFSVRRALPESAAYSLAFDVTLGRNVLTLLGWMLNANLLTVRSFTEAPDAESIAAGAITLALWLAGLAWRPLRERGWLAAGLLSLALLIPVLPLRNHVYHYYLYGPLAGAAWCLAAFVDVVIERLGSRRAAGALAGALAAVLTLNGFLFVQKIETTPFVIAELRSDPTVDRARIARNVYDGLRVADVPSGVSLRFWSPASMDRERDEGRNPGIESYWERNVRTALLDGMGVRVLFPGVRDVVFVRAFDPAPDSVRYAVYLLDGRVRVATSADLESALRSFPEAR